MKESIVDIAGFRYRYGYDPDTQRTVYLGPVGDSPELSEAEFLIRLAGIQTGHGPDEKDAYFVEYAMEGGNWVEKYDSKHEATRSLNDFGMVYDGSGVWDGPKGSAMISNRIVKKDSEIVIAAVLDDDDFLDFKYFGDASIYESWRTEKGFKGTRYEIENDDGVVILEILEVTKLKV